MPRREKRGKCDAQVVRHSLIDRAGPLIRHVSRPGLAEREALPARYYLGGVCGEGGGAREGSPRGLIATWGGPFFFSQWWAQLVLLECSGPWLSAAKKEEVDGGTIEVGGVSGGDWNGLYLSWPAVPVVVESCSGGIYLQACVSSPRAEKAMHSCSPCLLVCFLDGLIYVASAFPYQSGADRH